MPTVYDVTCYTPPSQLSLKEGDSVEVGGWVNGKRIRADYIKKENGPKCTCELPPKEKGARFGKVEGIVGSVTNSNEYIEFDLLETK